MQRRRRTAGKSLSSLAECRRLKFILRAFQRDLCGDAIQTGTLGAKRECEAKQRYVEELRPRALHACKQA